MLEQLSREVTSGRRLSFVVRGVGAEAILALIARVRQAERERDEARAEVARLREAGERDSIMRDLHAAGAAAIERYRTERTPYTKGRMDALCEVADVLEGHVVTREAFSADPGRYVRAADAGPVTVVGDDGATVMVLSTMEVSDE